MPTAPGTRREDEHAEHAHAGAASAPASAGSGEDPAGATRASGEGERTGGGVAAPPRDDAGSGVADPADESTTAAGSDAPREAGPSSGSGAESHGDERGNGHGNGHDGKGGAGAAVGSATTAVSEADTVDTGTRRVADRDAEAPTVDTQAPDLGRNTGGTTSSGEPQGSDDDAGRKGGAAALGAGALAAGAAGVAASRGSSHDEPSATGTAPDEAAATTTAPAEGTTAATAGAGTAGAATSDAPASDTPGADAPATDAPATDAPGIDAPGTDAAATGAPAAGTSASGPAPIAERATDPTAETVAPAPEAVDVRRRRRALLVAGIAALVLLLFLGVIVVVDRMSDDGAPPAGEGAAPAPGAPPAAAAPPAPPPRPQLPLGGTQIFPNLRIVAYYGSPGTPSLGVLGNGDAESAATKLAEAAVPFATAGRTVQPTMEIIVSVADGKPGPDGTYHHDISEAKVRQYLQVARAHKQMVVLDIQPGRADFPTAVAPWLPLLREPDVGLALDAEWRMGPDEVPGKVIGHVTAEEINAVSTQVAQMVRDGNLPQKLFLIHQFTPDEILTPERVATPPELAVVQHIDGFGAPPNKLSKYQELQRPQQWHMGFKLFYTQDTPMLDPQQALALQPQPELITYQ